MKISAKAVSNETKDSLRNELRRINSLPKPGSGDLERGRIIVHLLDGQTATTTPVYPLANREIEQLAKDFPRLVVEK